jgi:hypothetical protein
MFEMPFLVSSPLEKQPMTASRESSTVANQAQGRSERTTALDWPALALFFLLATAYWIPPVPDSFFSLPAFLRISWLSVLLVASYIVLFRRGAK